MALYITYPVQTNEATLLQLVYNYLESHVTGWEPAEGNLDVWLAEAISTETSDLISVASRVPDTIFRYFGASLMNIPPIEGTAAQGNTTWVTRDSAGYTIPVGTQVVVRDATGASIPFATLNEVTIPPGLTSTDPGAVVIIAIAEGSSGSGLGGIGTPVELLDILDYVDSVTLTGQTVGGQDQETDPDYLDRLIGQLALLTRTPILPQDYADLARNVSPVWRAVAFDGYNPDYNALSANSASVETDATGWAVVSACTIARSTAEAADGIASLKMTATGGDMVARAPSASSGAGAIAALPNETWTGIVSIKANPVGATRACRAELGFFNSGGTLVGTVQGTLANNSTSAWTAYTVLGVAPINTAFVGVRAFVQGPGAGEFVFVDKASLHRGSSIVWAPGGITTEFNNPRTVVLACVDQAGEAISIPAKSAVSEYLESLREVNFVVNVIDPNYSLIDVTAQVTILNGYDPLVVQESVAKAVQDYLEPSAWGQPPGGTDKAVDTHTWYNISVVRKYEVSQVINAVDGVNYITPGGLTMRITGGTMAEADIQLPGAIPLTRPGAITVSTSLA
jgi:hypothetical protein